MPAITPLKKIAFDAIDALHVGQIVMSFVYEEPPEVWYHLILGLIDEILEQQGMTGKQAEITKHYLLANLEICLSFDDRYLSSLVEHFEKNNADGAPWDEKKIKQSVEYDNNFTLAILSNIAEYNGVDVKFVHKIVNNLIEDKELALSTMPFFVKYRLTERCYAFEYPDAALSFYHELVSRKIISCEKYSRNIDKHAKEPESELSLLFIRAGLLFELKMLQRSINIMISTDKKNTIVFPNLDPKVSDTDRKMIADYYKRLIDAFLLKERSDKFVIFQCKEHVSEKNAKLFLKNMSNFYFHKRMFGGTQASWLGELGAFHIEASRWDEPNKAIYYEADNSLTISEKVKLKLLDYGFSVSARSLYLRHKEINENSYPKIKHYYQFLLKQEYSLPWYRTDSDFYYDLTFEFKERGGSLFINLPVK
ncbi:hypothetical protein ABN363_20030 [Providencia rettgeri]|uniref:hypothetical protein n=1 Tax=Providencia hangzhouensis TaxID=3031799 RepID=UPI0032DC12CB